MIDVDDASAIEQDEDLSVTSRPEPPPRPGRHLRGWHLLVAFGALASLSTLLQARGWYIADARFEHWWAGRAFLESHGHVWDAVRGLGRPTPYFSPLIGTVHAATDWLGVPPWVTERLTHAAYLTVAGTGMVQVMRLVRRDIGTPHVVAGLLYMFNPYTSQFIIPSGLFLHYAIAPWLVVSMVRGCREDRWRWAGVFAFCVFSVGALNAASVVFAMVPLVPTAIYLVLVDRSVSLRAMAGWVVRAGALTLGATAAALLVIVGSTEITAVNLATTEPPEAVSSNSSWAESWRGLGSWLSYLYAHGREFAPQARPYFDNPVVIVATFAVPALAMLALAKSSSRWRVLFGALMLTSLLLMVGLHPVGSSPPLGDALTSAFSTGSFFAGFRNIYKAGAGLAIGTAGLVGLAAASLAHWRRWTRLPVAGLGLCVLVVSAFPYWAGRLYSPHDRMQDVPEYWHDAVAWLDRAEGDGRVLVVPGVTRARYRWGYVGDDILDALLRRPHLSSQSLPQGTADAANLLDVIDRHIADGDVEVLAPILQRLGVQYVVVRNDLDWEQVEVPRPITYEPLRSSPDLSLEASFGEEGEFTVPQDADPEGEEPFVNFERRLPPVEIYEVDGAVPPVQSRADEPPLLVAGDGDAWFSIARAGILDPDQPVSYTGRLEPSELADALADGAGLVVTDTNRRRTRFVTGVGLSDSQTLTATERTNRQPLDLFDDPATQTVATFGDATEITSSPASPKAFRPANAVDGDPRSSWLIAVAGGPITGEMQIDLAEPTTISEVALTPASTTVGNVPTEVTLHFDEGPPVLVRLGQGTTIAAFPPRTTDMIEVRVRKTLIDGAPAGFSDIRVGDLDLRETIELPSALGEDAARDERLAEALETASLTYAFERLGGGPDPEELRLRRRFEVLASGAHEIEGWVRVRATTPDEQFDELLQGEVRAVGSTEVGGSFEGRGRLAIDGDQGTAWLAPASGGERLDLQFPEQRVDHIDLFVETGDDLNIPTSLVVTVGEGDAAIRQVVELDLDRGCWPIPPPFPDMERCVIENRIDVPRTTASAVGLEVLEVADTGEGSAHQIGITEVDPGSPRVTVEESLDDECRPLLFVDGRSVAVRLEGTEPQLAEGEPVRFTSCEPLDLDAGWHVIGSADEIASTVDSVLLRNDESAPPDGATPPTVEVVEDSGTRLELQVEAPDGGWVVSGQSYHPGWRAELDGESLGRATEVDTLAAWSVPAGTSGRLIIEYGPQRTYEIAFALSIGTAAACAALALRRRR